MTRHFIPGIDDEYKFTRPEFAQFLGISSNALRMKMRRGYFSGDYVIRNGKYLFKRPRPEHDVRPPSDHPTNGGSATGSVTNIKRSRNRGNHKEGDTSNYTNDAFRRHNEMKILNSINGKFKSDEHRRRFEELNDAALKKIDAEIAAEKEQKLKKELSRSSGSVINGYMPNVPQPSKYGTMLNGRGISEQYKKEQARLNRLDENKHRTKYLQKIDYEGNRYNTRIPDFSEGINGDLGSIRFGNFTGYDRISDDSDGAVEVQGVYEHTTYQNPLHEIPQGMSKVQEEIWKLKNKKV